MSNPVEGEITAETVLNFRSHYKEYHIDDLDAVFADMAEFVDMEKVTPNDFHGVVLSCGSHSVKYLNSRSKVGGLVFPSPQRNLPPKSYSSGNAAKATFAKILLRPIKIEGQEGSDSFLDRVEIGGDVAERLEGAFSNTFGEEALQAVKRALQERQTRAKGAAIHHENMPVVYIPGPEGDDLLTTPIPAVDSMKRMQDIKFEAFEDFKEKKAEADKDDTELTTTSGRWIRTIVSGKMRNAVLNMSENQYRFFSEMPEVISRLDSDLIVMKENSDWFPRFYDVEVADALLGYANRLDHNAKPETYVNQNISSGTDRLADMIIASAQSYIDETMTEFSNTYPEHERSSPSVSEVLKTLPVPKKDRMFAISALNTDHFKGRLNTAGVKS